MRALTTAIIALLVVAGGVLMLRATAADAGVDIVDTDRDGCTDAAELGDDPRLGGQRDPNNFWDFYDTPTPKAYERDRTVTVADMSAILGRFGSYGFSSIDPLSRPPPPPAYHTAYDRGYAGGPLWRSGPPDGRISIVDLILVSSQFGHNCA